MKFLVALVSVCVLGQALGDPVACGSGRPKVLTANSGTFTSPNYPSNYPNSANCEWRIDPPGNGPIILEFTDFGTESGYDLVDVHDGPSASSTRLIRASGSTTPAPITSTGGTLFLKFTSDSSVNAKGFSVSYSRPDSACSGGDPRVIEVALGETGTLTSPGHPEDYPANSQCGWTLQGPSNSAIELNFNTFVVEEEDLDGCRWDYVEIVDPVTQETNRHCGNDTPPARTSAGNALTVLFVSDQSIQRIGFSSTYRAVDRSSVTSPQPTSATSGTQGTTGTGPTGTGPTGTGATGSPPTFPPPSNITIPPVSSYLSGTFSSVDGEPIPTACLSVYNEEMRKTLVRYVGSTNAMIGDSLCSGFGEFKITDGETSLVALGSQALVSLRITQDAKDYRSFADHASCATEVGNHATDHSNWQNPIIPSIPGCSPVNFDPAEFELNQIQYDCDN